MQDLRKCECCGVELEEGEDRFCSFECYDEWYRSHPEQMFSANDIE